MAGEISPAIMSIEVDASKVDAQKVAAIVARIKRAVLEGDRPLGSPPDTSQPPRPQS